MKSVLLTGATGFIGRHCVRPLVERGYEVHAITSKEVMGLPPPAQWHRADLFDSERIRRLVAEIRPSHLLHFAWDTTPGVYWTSPDNVRWLQASLELLRAFSEAGGRRVVMAGTCAEYDWSHDCYDERTTPLAPGTLYGACKHALQVTLTALSRQTGMSAAWGRIFYLYGPHEHSSRLVASVARAVILGLPAPCSHGNQIRDLLHVRDGADAFACLLDGGVTGPINIASGTGVSLKEVVYSIAGKRNRADLIQLGVLPARAGEPDRLVADARRLREEVGWSPKIDLDRGIEDTLVWWEGALAGNDPVD